jgi:branched-chain amino acid transport system substrate-binding protein
MSMKSLRSLKLFTTVAAATLCVASAAAAAETKAAAPLKIGISLSLTGDFADPGKAAKLG